MGRGKGSRDILLGPNQFGRPKEQAVFKNKRDDFPTGVSRVLFTRKMDASPEILEGFVGDYSLIFRNPEGRYDDKLEATSTYFDYPPLAAIDFRTQFLLGKRILENVWFNLEGNKYVSNKDYIR